jgi:hypothetical protein
MLQFTASDRRSSYHERAVRDGFGHALELFRAREQRRSSHSGTRFAPRHFVRVHHAQAKKAEVAHGASGGADVERVARTHQDDAQTVEFCRGKQERLFYISYWMEVLADRGKEIPSH